MSAEQVRRYGRSLALETSNRHCLARLNPVSLRCQQNFGEFVPSTLVAFKSIWLKTEFSTGTIAATPFAFAPGRVLPYTSRRREQPRRPQSEINTTICNAGGSPLEGGCILRRSTLRCPGRHLHAPHGALYKISHRLKRRGQPSDAPAGRT